MRESERVAAEVESIARGAPSVVELCRSLHAAVSVQVPTDRWCAFAVDPSTLYATNGYHDEGLAPQLIPRMLEIEYGGGDVNDISAIARSATGVATLGGTTGGDPSKSARWRDVIEPSGLAHEMRAVFRDDDGVWGALVLLRGSDVADFSEREVRLLSEIRGAVSAAFRSVLVRQHLQHADDVREAGILILEGADLSIRTITPAAGAWIDALDDGGIDGRLPTAVASVARAALGGLVPTPAVARARTRGGRWLTITADVVEAAGGAAVGLVLQPSRPAEIALIVGAAHGLTPREAEVVRLVAAGHTNREIASALAITPYTVADHLKAIFRKLDVSSRGELTSRLFFDHYLPRSARPVGSDGFFLPA